MSAGRQIAAVAAMNIRTLPQRLGASSVIVVGIAGVVAVLVAILAIATGVTGTIAGTGRADRAIVLLKGSDAELPSVLSRDNVLTVMAAPGIRKDSGGKPVASGETLMIVDIPRDDGATANILLRGVGPEAFAVRPEIRIVEGRMFHPAVHELIVGHAAQERFKGLAVGSHVAFRGSDWMIVGAFDSRGDSHESELMADTETVFSALRRNEFQSVTVLLESPDSFSAFKDWLTTNPTLAVLVDRETDYYARQSQPLRKILFPVALLIGGIMAIGAVFGALNSMYSTIATRTREIATLRALGFGAGAVVISVLFEAFVLAILGGLAGALLVLLFFSGNIVSTSNGGFGLTQIMFPVAVTPGLVVLGILLASLIGLVGGLFPALRAARLPVAAALRKS